jgi:hypothetical protein
MKIEIFITNVLGFQKIAFISILDYYGWVLVISFRLSLSLISLSQSNFNQVILSLRPTVNKRIGIQILFFLRYRSSFRLSPEV